jgi:membrane associated rhomboid family serine protease
VVPLNDDNPTRITPFVTYGLIGLNIFIFLYELSLSPQQLTQFFQDYAIVPRELTLSLLSNNFGQILPQLSTLVTSQFLHGGFLHLAGNMLFLWVFGNNIEDQLGHVRFLIFYLACGALAGLAQWFFSMDSLIPSLGASGAIAAVLGAYILRFPKAKILTLLPLGFFFYMVRIPAVFFLGFWFAQQAFFSLLSLQAPSNMSSGGIAYWAHAGGFVFGAVLGPLFGLFPPKMRSS